MAGKNITHESLDSAIKDDSLVIHNGMTQAAIEEIQAAIALKVTTAQTNAAARTFVTVDFTLMRDSVQGKVKTAAPVDLIDVKDRLGKTVPEGTIVWILQVNKAETEYLVQVPGVDGVAANANWRIPVSAIAATTTAQAKAEKAARASNRTPEEQAMFDARDAFGALDRKRDIAPGKTASEIAQYMSDNPNWIPPKDRTTEQWRALFPTATVLNLARAIHACQVFRASVDAQIANLLAVVDADQGLVPGGAVEKDLRTALAEYGKAKSVEQDVRSLAGKGYVNILAEE